MNKEKTSDGEGRPYAITRLPSGGVEIQLQNMKNMKDVMALAKELIAPRCWKRR